MPNLARNIADWQSGWTKALPMARNTSVLLNDHFTHFIDEQVDKRTLRSASHVVSAGLQLLEEHEAKVKVLQDALIAGEESGEPQPFNGRAFIVQMTLKSGA